MYAEKKKKRFPHLEQSVKPCDDFVKHTCSKRMKGQFYMDFKQRDIDTLFKPYKSKEFVSFLETYEEYVGFSVDSEFL